MELAPLWGHRPPSLVPPWAQAPPVLLAQGSQGSGPGNGCSCLALPLLWSLGLPARARDGVALGRLSVAADHKVTRGDGLREGVLPWGVLSPAWLPQDQLGDRSCLCPGSPQRRPLWGLGDGRLHIWQGWTAPWRGRVEKHRVWGRHAEGPAWAEAEPGLREAEDRVDRGMPRPHDLQSEPATLGRGVRWAMCPAPAQWEGLGAQSRSSAVALGGSSIWGPWPLRTAVSPSVQEQVRAGLAVAGALAGPRLALLPGLRRPTGLLLWAPSEVHALLVHPLGLHPLDEAEEVLVWHGGASGQHVGWRAALVVNSGGLDTQVGWWSRPPQSWRGLSPHPGVSRLADVRGSRPWLRGRLGPPCPPGK